MSDLIAEPFTRLGAVQTLASQVGESFDKSYDVPWHSALICLVWTTLFVYWSYLILKRRDLVAILLIFLCSAKFSFVCLALKLFTVRQHKIVYFGKRHIV